MAEGGDDYFRPPLAKDLFADRPLFRSALDAFPQCKTIVPRLREPEVLRGSVSIEDLLQEIEEQSKTYQRGLQELAAVRCYLQRAISQCEQKWLEVTRRVTNYLALLREVERAHQGNEPVLLVTFNYDTLLEDALVDLGRKFQSMESYTRGTELFQVFKLHGSVNWGQEVHFQLPANLDPVSPDSAPIVLRYLIERVAHLKIPDAFVPCPPSHMGAANGRPVFPAIAIPVEKKRVFQCPLYMVDQLITSLRQVTAIFIIGWRATEEHFLDLLRQHLKPEVYTCIVSGNQKEAESIGHRLRQVLKQPSISPEGVGFTEFIRSRRVEALLHSIPMKRGP